MRPPPSACALLDDGKPRASASALGLAVAHRLDFTALGLAVAWTLPNLQTQYYLLVRTAVAVPAASAAEDAISPNVTVAVRADAISNALARAGAGPPLALVASAETPASHSSARFGNIVSDEDHMRDILYAVASSPTAVGAASRYSLDELEMALFSYRHGLCV